MMVVFLCPWMFPPYYKYVAGGGVVCMSLVIPDNLSVWISTFPKATELKSDPPTLCSPCVPSVPLPGPFSLELDDSTIFKP